MTCTGLGKTTFVAVHKNHQVKVYQTLYILIEEPSVDQFNKIMNQFIQNWKEKEPKFIEYFIKYYNNRPGTYVLLHNNAIELSVVLRDSEYIFALPSSCNSFVVITNKVRLR